MVMPVWLAAGAANGSEITLHVQPGASRSELAGLHGDALKLRIAARAVEGAANTAVLEFVADWLDVPKREVKLLRGEKSRRKTIWVPRAPAETAQFAAGL
jgi:uncharacterized protein (TIGR00251 family)